MTLGEEPDQLDPARTIELTANAMLQHMCEGLVYIGADGLPKPWVAESWEISEDNLTVSYGVYLYHIDAPGVGEKTGTFAIIK